MLLAEDYQEIRTLHQLYLFVSSALFSSENEKSESEDRFECVVHAVPSNVAFFLIEFYWVENSETDMWQYGSVADEELAAEDQEGQ